MDALHSRIDPAANRVRSYENRISGSYGSRIDDSVHNHPCVRNAPDLGDRVLERVSTVQKPAGCECTSNACSLANRFSSSEEGRRLRKVRIYGCQSKSLSLCSTDLVKALAGNIRKLEYWA